MASEIIRIIAIGGGTVAFVAAVTTASQYLGRLIKAVERSATVNELTALYTRELCWRKHDAAKVRNGNGHLMRWQDPAEDPMVAGRFLADAAERMRGKGLREALNGPELPYWEYTDVGPEAEAAKAAMAETNARNEAITNEMLARFSESRQPKAES